MTILDNIKNTIQSDIDARLHKQPSGIVLKHDLGLDNIKHVYIQKIIGTAINIYVVSYNSRFPSLYIPRSKLKQIKTMTLNKVRSLPNKFLFINFKLTPPVELDDFIARIPSNSIIITQDICGDRFQNKAILESKEIKIDNEVVKVYG